MVITKPVSGLSRPLASADCSKSRGSKPPQNRPGSVKLGNLPEYRKNLCSHFLSQQPDSTMGELHVRIYLSRGIYSGTAKRRSYHYRSSNIYCGIRWLGRTGTNHRGNTDTKLAGVPDLIRGSRRPEPARLCRLSVLRHRRFGLIRLHRPACLQRCQYSLSGRCRWHA